LTTGLGGSGAASRSAFEGPTPTSDKKHYVKSSGRPTLAPAAHSADHRPHRAGPPFPVRLCTGFAPLTYLRRPTTQSVIIPALAVAPHWRCRIVPLSPTAQTSVLALPHTPKSSPMVPLAMGDQAQASQSR